MRNRQEIAKRLDKVMAEWRVVNADYEKTPFDHPMRIEIYNALTELETQIYTLRWVLEMN